jgi:gliding motility-associated-like protein|tara:strand:+ start:899 stop:3172 length:2274 start_codon:yes stop_codon:yes gene_type:complete
MKRKLLFLVLCLPLLGLAQKEGNIWYFGKNAGLDFNSGIPVALTDGELYSVEGCASICDANGDLLFYTDGMTVYNKNHGVMPNGTGLLGHNSSSQSAIIVKKPMSNNLYYIFTVDGISGNAGGLNYSVVDMNLDLGLGDITADKNILLFADACEKVTAIKHQNGVDFWIVAPQHTTNTYYSYLLTSVGLSSAPVLNNVGSVPDDVGYLKASPDGTKIIAANSYIVNSFLFDFDRTTGILSNVINFPSAYGAEFSSSSHILYLNVIIVVNGAVEQYNLLAGTATDILNSKIVLTTNITPSALQLAPDGKIYIAREQNFLGAIDNPDVLGVGCNYDSNAVFLNGKTSYFGLPAFFSSIFSSPIEISGFCLGDSTRFVTDMLTDSLLWDFGDGITSVLDSVNHLYQDTGLYIMVLEVYNGLDTVIITDTINITTPYINLRNDTALCDGEILTLDVTQTDATYLWQDGSASPTFTVTSEGTYSVDLTLEGCSAQASISVIYNVLPTATISGDFSVCEDQWSYFPIVCTGVPDFSVSWTNGTLNGTATGRYLIKIPAIITGVYTLVNIVDEAGCVGNVSGSANLVAHPKPIAEFVLNPAVTFIDNTDITFTNLSSGHTSSVWDFDDGSSLLNDNSLSIVHHYANPGDYIIKLEVTSNFGCVASEINSLEIIPFEYFVPNAFTPNSDALNDVFNINTTKVKSFEMEIFDRWGETVYITKNVWKPWDGTFNGTALEQGVYAYKIWVKDPQDILHKMVGNVLLVR